MIYMRYQFDWVNKLINGIFVSSAALEVIEGIIMNRRFSRDRVENAPALRFYTQ